MRHFIFLIILSIPQISFSSSDVDNKVLMDIIKTIPELEEWRECDTRRWSIAVEIDNKLRNTEGYSDLALRERLLIVLQKAKEKDQLKAKDWDLYKLISGSPDFKGGNFGGWLDSLSPEVHQSYTQIAKSKNDIKKREIIREAILYMAVTEVKESECLLFGSPANKSNPG